MLLFVASDLDAENLEAYCQKSPMVPVLVAGEESGDLTENVRPK